MSVWRETEIGKIPSSWGVTTIGNIAEIVTDGAHLSPKFYDGGKYMASVKDMTYDKFDFSECKTISNKDFEVLQRQGCSPQKGDILISKDGEKCLDLIFIYEQEENIVLLSSIAIVRLKKEYDPYFYRYFLLSYVGRLIMYKWFRSGTAIPRVVLRDFKNVPVPKLLKAEQYSISIILRKLDQKIALLRKQNQTLEEVAQIIFKRWFVEFNFPDKNGNPYKLSGGRMKDSELGEIPEGWRVGELGEIIINHDSKRVPLSSNERAKKQGKYPYYGATSIMDYVDDYLFDGRYLLLGEDGSVIDDKGFPVLQYIEGKIWVNNHAHVLEGKELFSTDYLFLQLRRAKVNHIVTGAVQLKINQSNLNSLEILIPDANILSLFNKTTRAVIDKVFINQKEIQTLTKLRDTLLPKLMSGEIRVAGISKR